VSGVGAGNGDAAAPAPQQWSAERYAQHAAFVPAFGASLLERLAPRAGERILDLGCGDGTLTRQIAERGAAVVGVDAAPDFVAAAAKAGADAALDGVFQALRPGGRFVAEFGGHGCIAAIVVALTAALQRCGRLLQSPWYFPTAEEYAAKLTAHGFEIDSIELYPRLTPLPTGIRGWLETFAGPMIDVLPDAERASLVDDVETLLRPMLCDTAGRWTADYVRLRLIARRPGSAKASAERSATAARRTLG